MLTGLGPGYHQGSVLSGSSREESVYLLFQLLEAADFSWTNSPFFHLQSKSFSHHPLSGAFQSLFHWQEPRQVITPSEGLLNSSL